MQPPNITIIRYAVGLWIIYHYSITSMDFSFFWGEFTFANLENILGVKNDFAMILVNKKSPLLNALFLFFLFGVVMADFCGLSNILLRSLTWIFVVNLDNYVYSTLNGGNNLIHLILLFLILAPSGRNVPFTNKTILSKGTFERANKTVLTIIQIQLCIVYLSAGLSKLTGNLWPSGTAIFYTLSNPDYSIPFIYKNIGYWHPLFHVIPNYIVLSYQILFPFLCWSRFKPYLLILGLAIHLSIGLFLGLPSFAGAVIAIYSSFLDKNTCSKLLYSINEFKKQVSTRLVLGRRKT